MSLKKNQVELSYLELTYIIFNKFQGAKELSWMNSFFKFKLKLFTSL